MGGTRRTKIGAVYTLALGMLMLSACTSLPPKALPKSVPARIGLPWSGPGPHQTVVLRTPSFIRKEKGVVKSPEGALALVMPVYPGAAPVSGEVARYALPQDWQAFYAKRGLSRTWRVPVSESRAETWFTDRMESRHYIVSGYPQPQTGEHGAISLTYADPAAPDGLSITVVMVPDGPHSTLVQYAAVVIDVPARPAATLITGRVTAMSFHVYPAGKPSYTVGITNPKEVRAIVAALNALPLLVSTSPILGCGNIMLSVWVTFHIRTSSGQAFDGTVDVNCGASLRRLGRHPLAVSLGNPGLLDGVLAKAGLNLT